MATSAQVMELHDFVLARARGGDTSAFAEIVQRYQTMVFGLAMNVLRSRAAAEDLAQDVFLQLYRNLHRIESQGHAICWLRRVTSHRCIDQLRRARHRLECPLDHLPDPGAAA